MANSGMLQALSSGFQHIFCDRLNHASIIDGLLQGKTPFTRYRHLDLDHLESLLKKQNNPEHSMVVTETLFSMEGDFLPLEELLRLQEKYGFFLYLDEAHSVGGYPDYLKPLSKSDPDKFLIMGTFGKALGGFGAFVAGKGVYIDYFINKCRSFIFSTALPPAVIASALASIGILKQEKWRIKKIHSLTKTALELFQKQGFDTGQSSSHIIPIILGENEAALSVSQYMIDQGIFVLPVRPPAVPAGKARLRVEVIIRLKEAQGKSAI
jgi:8-amino-7-oxononanoate synthase